MLNWPGNDERTWLQPELLLAQTCGYPLVTLLRDRVRLVATPCYSADGCRGPYYRSWIIARTDDPREAVADFARATVAINDPGSLSGCMVWRLLDGKLPVERRFASILCSGSHERSITAVSSKEADIAAIDCVTWALIALHRPTHLAGVRRLAAGPALPGLPLISASGTTDRELEALRVALYEAIRDPELVVVRQRLLIREISWLDMNAYHSALAGLMQPAG